LNFPFYIARRYLFAKKSRNAINIISIISVVGVAVGTMALIVILSVFNGFDKLVHSLYNSFDPDLKVSLNEGKVFIPDSAHLDHIRSVKGVKAVSLVLEENALLRYDERQHISVIKGVDSNYQAVTGIDSMIIEGKYFLKKGINTYAVMGQGVAYYLAAGIHFVTPLQIYVPKRTGNISLNPERAINKNYAFPSAFFAIEQEIDSKYVLLPLKFVQNLLEYYDGQVSALEIGLLPGTGTDEVEQQVRTIVGPEFKVQNRYQQKEFFYKIMKSEKWAIFFILSFILVVASFNVIGSLTMLILDKKDDVATLRSLGITIPSLRSIFLLEGWMISLFGAIAGLLLGAVVCWIQLHFEVIQLQGSGSFVIDAYPVAMKISDFILIFFTVVGIGFLAAWYPVRFITRRFVNRSEKLSLQ